MFRRAFVNPGLFVPTWLIPEETLLAGLAGLDDDMLSSIDIGRFAVGLHERLREESTRRG